MIGRQEIVAAIAGLLFAIGLGLSGMTDANKVIGFLNVVALRDGLGAPGWDYSLGLVMGGALMIYVPVFRLYQRKRKPIFGGDCNIPDSNKIDSSLLIGGALFGLGWALAGFCPGPGILSLVTGTPAAIVFVVTMLLGMGLQRRMR